MSVASTLPPQCTPFAHVQRPDATGGDTLPASRLVAYAIERGLTAIPRDAVRVQKRDLCHEWPEAALGTREHLCPRTAGGATRDGRWRGTSACGAGVLRIRRAALLYATRRETQAHWRP